MLFLFGLAFSVFFSLFRAIVRMLTMGAFDFDSLNNPCFPSDQPEQVSIIVEADPDVLRDKRVQLAVEGRFCDSAISVREAALELVGRHIASHPDVGLQVCGLLFVSLFFVKVYPHSFLNVISFFLW